MKYQYWLNIAFTMKMLTIKCNYCRNYKFRLVTYSTMKYPYCGNIGFTIAILTLNCEIFFIIQAQFWENADNHNTGTVFHANAVQKWPIYDQYKKYWPTIVLLLAIIKTKLISCTILLTIRHTIINKKQI